MICSILGFDARSLELQQLQKLWPRERRQRYLLNPDIEVPYSVDRTVWPSVIDAGYLDPANSQPLYIWEHLSDVFEAIKTLGNEISYAPVAIALYSDAGDEINQTLEMCMNRSSEEELNANRYSSAGFDVADGYLGSALSNMSPSLETIAALRSRWNRSLNSVGLFRDFSDASDFKLRVDETVQSHRPFFVCEVLTLSNMV